MQSSQPLVSVVIACYNHEQFVQDSIQSVIDQDYENIELIIIDDGSKDNSVSKIQEMIAACKERFVRFEFRYRDNIGLSSTLNEALEWCEGEYFCGLASDDIVIDKKVSNQVKIMEENNKIVATFGSVKYINEHGDITGRKDTSEKLYTFSDIINHKHNLQAPTQMIRASALKKTGGYISGMILEDWYMWLKLSMIGDIYCQSDILSLYRRHSSNTTNDLELMHEGRLQVLEYFKDTEDYESAMKKLKWVNALQELINRKDKKIKNFIIVCYLDPARTIKGFLKRTIKIVGFKK